MDSNMISKGINQLLAKLETWVMQIIEHLPNILLALVVIFLSVFISAWVYKLIIKSLESSKVNESLEHLIANCCKILVICFGVVLALGVLDLQKTVFSLLAGVGVIGLALGFAFQDLAANFISGVMLAIRTPIEIGDIVKINDIQGTVEDIRLRDTIIKTFGGQQVFVPNKEFTANSFTNYSSNGERRVKIEVGIGYEDDPVKGREIIVDALKKVDNILEEPAPAAFVESLGGSSVNLRAQVWIKYPGASYLEVQHEMITKVKKDLEDAGYNIPFPIRTLDVADSMKELFKDNFQKSSNVVGLNASQRESSPQA